VLLATPAYCASRFAYQRRKSREVAIGNVIVGGDQPIAVQSMTTTRTQDIEGTLAQTIRLVDVGCEIVRITAPTVIINMLTKIPIVLLLSPCCGPRKAAVPFRSRRPFPASQPRPPLAYQQAGAVTVGQTPGPMAAACSGLAA